MLSMASRSLGLRQVALLAVTFALVYVLFFSHLPEDNLWLFGSHDNHDNHPPPQPEYSAPPSPAPELPAEYQSEPTDNTWCQDRYGTKYLTNARDSPVSYCKPQLGTDLTCFWSQTADSRRDAICYADGAIFDASQKKFRLSCGLRDMSNEDKGVPRFPEDLPIYWYETGPGFIVAERLELDEKVPASPTNRTSILVKREGSQNPWHSLLEIMSLSWSLDVLQMAVNEQTDEPFLGRESGPNTQIVLLDPNDDGPYIELWQMFAKMPVRRIDELGPEEPSSNIIIPFSGGSNTLWQGDWDALDCHDGALLRTYADRALKQYDVASPDAQEIVSVTYIQRTNTRKLINEAEHINALKEKIPHMVLEVVDFEKLTFPQQLEIVRRTDVLVGVHGAGLAHTLFLRPGSALVEIQPEGFNHQGFRNLAQMLDLGYFRTHADLQEKSQESDDRWQMEAVQIDQDKFINIVDVGVRSLYNRAGRSFDTL